jgi:hypothetical protein
MGFTKLDEGLLFSSIMQESAEVFKVWIALLAACKEDGIARVSAVGLAGVCFLTLDVVIHALDVLGSSDKNSRTTKENGKRIKRVDGGYFVINYHKYRELSYKEVEAKRKYLKYHAPEISGESGKLPEHSASASASLLLLPLSELLLIKIKEQKTEGVFKPERDLPKWSNIFRLMIEQDHRTGEQIEAKIEAVFRDSFWSKQIRSAGKLREKWNEGKLDRLIIEETQEFVKKQWPHPPDDYLTNPRISPESLKMIRKEPNGDVVK